MASIMADLLVSDRRRAMAGGIGPAGDAEAALDDEGANAVFSRYAGADRQAAACIEAPQSSIAGG